MEEISLINQLNMIEKHMITLERLHQVKMMFTQLNVYYIIPISKNAKNRFKETTKIRR